MRQVFIGMFAWLCAGAAYAQIADLPPLVLPPPPEYSAPPSTLVLPENYSLLAVEQARGNLARWRDAERRRIGAYIPARGPDRAAERALPGVGGYFALFAGAAARPGIAYGYWSDPSSDVGSRSAARGLVLRSPYTICGGQLPWAGDAYLGDIAYLGNTWRPEFEDLDSLLGASDHRIVTGREIPAEVLPFAPSQPMPDVSRFYPARAMEREIEAVVLMGCRVEADFTLQCGVIGVDVPRPALGALDWRAENYTSDFGRAAIRVMQSSRLRVTEITTDGQSPSGACVRRRIRFAIPR